MGWIIAATCAFLAFTIWERRWTMFAPSDTAKLTERTMTTALILQFAGLFLKSPLSSATVGHLFHAATGQWNIEDWAGDCCYIGAAGMIGTHVGSRLDVTHDEFRAGFKRHFEYPMTILVPVLLALLIKSPNASSDSPDMGDNPTDYWLDTYWTLLCGFIAYTLYQTTRALRILRRDPRNKTTATIYLAACTTGIVACALRIITTWTDDNYSQWLWVGECAVAIACALAAGRSWRQKVLWLAGSRARSL